MDEVRQAEDSKAEEGPIAQRALSKYELRSHMDAIRALHFVESLDTLVSASEDCTIKLWSIKSLEEENDGNFEPYITLRGHTGPILSMAGSTGRRIFTGSNEGMLKVWDIPDRTEVNPYGDTLDGRTYCTATVSDQVEEPIWDMALNPMTDLLLTTSANSSVKIWQASAPDFDN